MDHERSNGDFNPVDLSHVMYSNKEYYESLVRVYSCLLSHFVND
jgi:hypothetical protein